MEVKSKSFEELAAYISKFAESHATTDCDEMGIYYEMCVFEELILFSIEDGYQPKKYDLQEKLAKWNYRKLISACGRFEKDCEKNLLPEKTAILYKQLMTEFWDM
jgi:hypothetical protein